MQQVILGIVRHVLTAGGGALVALDFAKDEQITAVIPAIVTLAGFIWSVVDKIRNR